MSGRPIKLTIADSELFLYMGLTCFASATIVKFINKYEPFDYIGVGVWTGLCCGSAIAAVIKLAEIQYR